jgi:type IV fimbrial biogenesis protein FimT
MSAHRPPPRWRVHHQAGITLLELAVAIAVLVVLGTVALPPLGERLQRQRLALAAETLAADLAEARFEAARLGRAVQVTALAGPQWCWALGAEVSAAASAPACPANALRVVAAKAHAGVAMVSGGSVRIEPVGTTATGTVAVFSSPKGDRLRVDMLALGRARVCSEKGAQGRYSAC